MKVCLIPIATTMVLCLSYGPRCLWPIRFPDGSNHVINGDHNDDNSDNYVDYNDENDVNFMVIMIQSGPRNLKGYLWKSSFLVKLQS